MEASLRDLLERLDGVAAGTARSHDTPTHLVEEVKEVLEHLASDELPAASAVFLSKDHPGALRHLEGARARGKLTAAANAGRAKLFELIAWYLTRLDAGAVEPYAQDVMRECLRTFRTERGTQKTVKAAALAPLASLLRLGATRLSRDETRALACELREDYERHTANTARVKGMILRVIAAMHDRKRESAPDGPLSREREEAFEEDGGGDGKESASEHARVSASESGNRRRSAGTAAGSKPAPDPRWLLRVGLAIATGATGASTSATLVAEAFDAVGSALGALHRARVREEEDGKKSVDAARTAPETPSAAPLDDDARRRIAEATLDALALPGGGQRSDVTRAALRMVADHARVFAAPPGMLSMASEYFKALLLCRASGNRNIRQAASPATDAFLAATADALSDASTAPEAEREAIWVRLSDDALSLMDAKDTEAKARTAAVRAVGKLARAGVAVGGFGDARCGFDPDVMLARIARWTSSERSFADGSDDFDRRHEAMERQNAVLGAYADLLVARGADARAPQPALASLARGARWAWEHYFVAGARAREDTRSRLAEAFEALAFRGGIATLTGVLSSISRSLVALSLRVAPPDPLDSAAFCAAPEPLWPEYVDLWTRLMRGGDTASVETRARARATYDAFVRETLQLCQTLQLRVVPAARGAEASEARGDDERRDEDDAATRALALELGEGVAAENPGDMRTFLCLVDLFCAVLAGAPARHVERWLTTLIENVAALSAAHPLLSGFYKIARAALVAADDAGVFETTRADSGKGADPAGDPEADPASLATSTAKETCRAFLLDVLGGVERLSDELRAAALQLLLSAPAGLLAARELAPALSDALAVGAHYPPLARAALDVLDRWTGTRSTRTVPSDARETTRRETTHHHRDHEEIRALLPSMVRSLRAYVDRRGASLGPDAGGDASFDVGDASDLNAGDAYRSARRAVASARAADRSAGPEHDIDARVARVLGAVGGAAHHLIDDDDRRVRASGSSGSRTSASAPSTLWDFERRVSLDVDVGENARITIWLDQMLPRAAHCALSSTDRAAKVAAAEFLHAATLLMVGRNARAFAPAGGDHAREPTPFHNIYASLFPVVLTLAIDQEPVTRQLFASLATQLVRWFTRNQAREAAETMALLDAVVGGLAGDPARARDDGETETGANRTREGLGGTRGTGGAAARRRDLCASLAAECLKWSVRSVPSGDPGGVGPNARRGAAGTSDGDGRSVAVNVSSLLRRLFAFQTHPDPARRLGAAVALRLCLAELRSFPDHDEAHALEILETALRSLRLAERDPPGAGAAEAGALLARAATRACARHAVALCLDPNDTSASASRGGSFGTLPRLVSWLFADGTARVETRARLESQLAFGALAPRTAGYVSPRAWVAAARAKAERARSKRRNEPEPADADADLERRSEPFALPFRVRAPAPEPEALAAGADEAAFPAARDATRGDVSADIVRARTTRSLEIAEAWMRGLVAALHWARWALERDLVALEDLVPEPEAGPRDGDHPLRAASFFLRRGVPRALRGIADDDVEARRSASAFSPAARAWRKARVRLSVQILVLAELAAREKSGVGAFFEALQGGGDEATSGETVRDGSGERDRLRRVEGSKIDPSAVSRDPSRDGIARLACAAALAPETLGADIVGGRMDDVNQLAGASARFLAPAMGDAASPEMAPLRRVARATLRHALAYHPRFDLGAADAHSAEGLRAARRLAAGYRALANVNLLRPLLPQQTPLGAGAETETEIATTSKPSPTHEMSRARLARRLLLAARALGPEASPAQVAAGREWVTLAAHIGASPEFVVRLALGDAETFSEAPTSGDDGETAASPSRAFSPATLGEWFLQTFRKDVVAAVRWNFPACVEALVRRVVDGGDGETAALQLLFAALDAPANGAETSFVETKILEALAPHLETIASLADRSSAARARRSGARAASPGGGNRARRREGSEADRKTRDAEPEPEPETETEIFERFDERRRACVELARRAVTLDAACAGSGPGRGRVLFPERRAVTATAEEEAPGDALARAVASVARPDTESFAGDDVGPAQREALAAFPALLAAGGNAAAITAAAAARLARLLRDSGASRAPAGSADGAAFAAARAGILRAAATPCPGYEARAAETLAAVVAVVADDADGGTDAVAATFARFADLAVERRGDGDSGALSSAWPAEALAAAAWALASDAAADVDERVVAGAVVLPSLAADARSQTSVGAFFASHAESMLAMLDPDAAARALASGETSPGAAVAGARASYAALAAMYERCSKETVAAGPGAAVTAFNAAVSRRAVLDLDGGGVIGVAAAAAAKARDEWTRRRGLEGFRVNRRDDADVMDIDGDDAEADGEVADGAPDLLPEDAVVAARRAAFGAFAALVARTQTKAKFFEKLFEGGAARWNALAGGASRDANPWTEAETASFAATRGERKRRGSRFVPESRFANPEDDGARDASASARRDPARVNEPADPSLAFTLSGTLSAGDPTLAHARGALRDARLRGSAGSRESTPRGATRESPGETEQVRRRSAPRRRSGDASRVVDADGPTEPGTATFEEAFFEREEGPTDEMERHPVAEAAFVALERAASGACHDVRSLRDIVNDSERADWTTSVQTPRVFRLVASLAADPSATPRARAFVIKAVLRLHRREVAIAEKEAASKEAASNEAARQASFFSAGDEDMEVEVVAEKSLEEVEHEKLRRAREEGNYLDLTSSQTETVTTPPEREEAEPSPRPCPPPRSTLAAHARVMLPGVLRGVLDVSRDVGCHVLHATLREAAVAALECDVAWLEPEPGPETRKDERPFAAVQELTARVITASPSRNALTLRQNVALAVSLARRLVGAAGRRALETEGSGTAAAAAAADAAAARALRPALDAAADLMASDLSKPASVAAFSRADADTGRTARLCGVQIVGALANGGVLDLGGETPVIRYVPEERDDERDENRNDASERTKSRGFAVTGWTSEFLCAGATTCLMEAGANAGRILHGAAASFLGLALAQRRAALVRRASAAAGSADLDAEEDEDEDANPAPPDPKPTVEPRWCATLRRRLRSLYERGPQDAFAAAADRIARRDPVWLAEAADGAILAQLHQIFPRLHGEPRFAAVRALARVAAADAALGAAFAERVLTSSVDGLEALLSTRDAQVHALALRALADALPCMAAEHARWPRGKKMDLDAWRRAATRAEQSLWNAGDGAARDAHVAFCAALAKAAPSLADLPAIRAPLLRAVVDGRAGGEDGARRDVALEYWDARLPGRAASVAEGDRPGPAAPPSARRLSGSASNPFSRRVRAALGVLPTGEGAGVPGRDSGALESASTRLTASGWLAATCDVILSVPRALRESFHAPLCDADLAECEFRDAVVDVAWQGASLPMAPLFSTQAALPTQATQSGAFGASVAGTQTLIGTPSALASSASLASAPAVPGESRLTGVAATPAPFAGGATFATPFGGARSTSSAGGSRAFRGPSGAFAGAFDALVGATQAELPPWLRGSTGPGAGGDASVRLGADADGAEASPKPARRLESVSKAPESADADASAAFSKASAAERRRRFERERALARRRAVTLTRRYRAGELPDARAATPAALLEPLAALARRDAETASAFLTALLEAALAADETAAVGEKRKAPETETARAIATETDAGDAGDATTRAAATATSSDSAPKRETLRDAARDAVAALLPAASADPTLAAWALRVVAADPDARFDADTVRAIAFDGGCLASGVLALEARALHIQSARGAEDAERRPDGAPAAPAASASTVSVWDALAALHRASGDDVAARLCLTRAFDGHETSDARVARTRAALTAQIEGDASSARDIYDALLREDVDAVDETDGTARKRLARLWSRERARCSQRLGDWDELALDVAESVPPPWSIERLRSGSGAGVGERVIPGAAAGGDALCFATRALARRATRGGRAEDAVTHETHGDHAMEEDAELDGSLEALLAHVACAPLGPVSSELGVELATVRFTKGLEDAVVAHVAAVRARFCERWAATPTAATFARRALLQPLQAATELEEVLGAVRACRAGETARARYRNRRERPMENVTARWSRRWPSDARDPPEAWERVEWVRHAASRAFLSAVPRSAAEAWSEARASPLARAREAASLVRSAKGARRAGEMRSAYDRLARAKSALTEGGRAPPPVRHSWLVQKAVCKLRLAQADAPRAFGVDGARAAREESDAARAGLLRGALRSLRRVREEGSLSAWPDLEAEAAACVGAIASRLARLEAPEAEGSDAFAEREPRGAGRLNELACVEYARAATLAGRWSREASAERSADRQTDVSRDDADDADGEVASETTRRRENAARAAAKASLRFASHCEATLCAREASALGGAAEASLGGDSFPPASAASDATAAVAFHPEGLEPTLARHALLALAGGAGARARHLVPRVLASLRGDARDAPETSLETERRKGNGGKETSRASTAATAAEFARLAPRVPRWLFLEWLPQLYALLDAPGPGGDAALATVERLASSYPSAVYAQHRVARAEFSKVGAARCARRLDATLTSPAGEAFARAVTLLDFPAQRLAWWRAHVKLLVAGAVASADGGGGGAAAAATIEAASAAFAAAEAATRDVGTPDEPHLGALNRRFAQLAKGPLSRALSEARKKLPRTDLDDASGFLEACRALSKNVAEAEKTVAERWRSSSGAAATEARPRLALAHFSRWFAVFDGSGDGNAAGASARRDTETSAAFRAFRGGVEIPGQYDAPRAPPCVEEHATVVGFEPEVAVFASKQRPKKITLRGSDGREYAFIAKGSEDLRQDDRIERLFSAMDGLFAEHPAAKRRGLHARTFHVAPLSRRAGLLEFVGGTKPMLEALGARTKSGDAVGTKHQHWIKAQALHPAGKRSGFARRRDAPGAKLSAPAGAASAAHFLEAMATTPRADARAALDSLRRRAAAASSPAASRAKPALRRALLQAAGSPDAFLAMRSRYAASLAASSVCGWVAGVGDRHLQNILLDVETGSVVHIDFGYAFGTATSVLPIPELVPFRLTDAMLDGLAPNDGVRGLRADMVVAVRALQGGAALLRGVADAFLRSPLADWRREVAQARVKAGRRSADETSTGRDDGDGGADAEDVLVRHRPAGGGADATDEEARHVELKVAQAFCKLELGNPGVLALMQCHAKHSGQAHWRGMREMVLGLPAEGDDAAATRGGAARRAAGDALRCDSVEQQVACLLELATDPLVLATSWSGWRPWL